MAGNGLPSIPTGTPGRTARNFEHIRDRESNSKWVSRYRKNKAKWDDEREQTRIREQSDGGAVMSRGQVNASGFVSSVTTKISSNMAVQLRSSASLPSAQVVDSLEFQKFTLPPINVRQALPCQSWQASWQRNTYCEVSGLPTFPGARRECMYCPVVVRRDFLQPREQKRAHWICHDCRQDIASNKAYIEKEKARAQLFLTEQKAALIVQKRFRGNIKRRQYDRVRSGATRLSSCFRGRLSRQAFQKKQCVVRRPFKIKIHKARRLRAADQEGTSDPFITLAVVQGNNVEAQIFLMQTKVQTATCDPDFEETFLIPGADGLVTLAFTVIDYDELRNDFLGQAVLKLKGTSIWAQGGVFDLPLDFMRIPPKESNRTNMRLGCQDEAGEGMLQIEIKPLPNYASHCGHLASEESAMSNSGGRKWWAVLADGHLRLYLHYGEEKERHSINLKKASAVVSKKMVEQRVWYVLEIRCPDQLWIFQAPTIVDHKQWYTRLRHIHDTSHKDKD